MNSEITNCGQRTDAIAIFEKASHPPKWALKTIEKGRLAGMTDIRPAWRIRALTEIYGLCGIGWRYEIVRTWTEDCSTGDRLCHAEVHLFVRDPSSGEWSAPIPGFGGNKTVSKESQGLHANDEGLKMAITDAISVCSRMIGIGAAVYESRWDGSKYLDGYVEEEKPATNPAPTPEEAELIRRADALEEECQLFSTKEEFSARKKALNAEYDGKVPPTLLRRINDCFRGKFPEEARKLAGAKQ